MNEEEFLEKMADLLDCEEKIAMTSVLADIEEWDSLSFVSFLAMAKAVYGKKINPPAVRSAETISNLYELVKS